MTWPTPFVVGYGNKDLTLGSQNSGTINTTGATFLLAFVVKTYLADSFTDSAGNTWTLLQQTGPSENTYSSGFALIYYCNGPTTSTTHNFYSTGATNPNENAICVLAFNAAGTITADQHTGTANTTPISNGSTQPGSITPTTANQLVVSGFYSGISTGYGPAASGFTVPASSSGNGINGYCAGLGYQIQTTATAVNPTWGAQPTGGTCNSMAVIASFKLVSAGPTINTQPTNQTAKIGATATFTAAATASAGSLTAQWQKNATNISGATNPTTYTTPPVSQGDDGATFDCVYTDSNGSVTTSTATLTVAPDTAAGPFFYQLLGSNHV